MLETGGAGHGELAGQGVRVARVGLKRLALLGEGVRDRLIGAESGMRHGSEPFAIAPSDSTITGVWYLTAIRTASTATSKQSDGDRGASTATGDSPLRPNIACSRSACSVLVGRPVDGPPRCTSITTNGSSVITARPMASDFSEIPGPEVVVTPSAPP